MSGVGLTTASSSEIQSPTKIDLSAFPGEIVNQVVVPIPAEVFAVLDKMEDQDWRSAVDHDTEHHQLRDRRFLALCFGSLVAEGFIAVQAQSQEDIDKIGRRSLKLADALGLESAVQSHCLAVIGGKKWGDDVIRRQLSN